MKTHHSNGNPIYDYVVDFESGSDYERSHFDNYDEALKHYNKHYQKWDYTSLQHRSMDPLTMKDVYETLISNECD